MNPHDKRSQQQQRQQENLSASHQQHVTSQGAQEFADSDEVLRFDAAQTIVPPAIAQRLHQTLGGARAKSWWRKLLGL